jgi:hypothetical protein
MSQAKMTTMDAKAIAMLAYDISNLLDRFEYPVGDFDPAELEKALPAFLRAFGVQMPGDTPAAPPAPAPEEFVRHNHDGGKLFFGQYKKPGECPRCDQLRAGAAPREAHPAITASKRKQDAEEQTRAAMREHFRPGGPHERGECGPVCTKFDY